MDIYYATKFHKHFISLPKNIQQKAIAKEKIFRQNPLDSRLKAHLLTGSLKGYYSFSITYHYRILFIFEKDGSVTFIDIGTHSIYQ